MLIVFAFVFIQIQCFALVLRERVSDGGKQGSHFVCDRDVQRIVTFAVQLAVLGNAMLVMQATPCRSPKMATPENNSPRQPADWLCRWLFLLTQQQECFLERVLSKVVASQDTSGRRRQFFDVGRREIREVCDGRIRTQGCLMGHYRAPNIV